MKKTCEGCAALDAGDCISGAECGLGYKINKAEAKPLEACPKPMTKIKFSELHIMKSRKDSLQMKCS